jgi:hypothetical protein
MELGEIHMSKYIKKTKTKLDSALVALSVAREMIPMLQHQRELSPFEVHYYEMTETLINLVSDAKTDIEHMPKEDFKVWHSEALQIAKSIARGNDIIDESQSRSHHPAGKLQRDENGKFIS